MEAGVRGLSVFHGRRMNSLSVWHIIYTGKGPRLNYDRSPLKSAGVHSMTYNPSLLSCKIEIDNKILYWFCCLHSGWHLQTAHVHVWIWEAVTASCSPQNTPSLLKSTLLFVGVEVLSSVRKLSLLVKIFTFPDVMSQTKEAELMEVHQIHH